MEPSPHFHAIEQTLDEIKSIFTKEFQFPESQIPDLLKKTKAAIREPESQIPDLLEKTKAATREADVKAQVILKQQLSNVLTDIENLHTEPSRKASDAGFFRVKSSGKRTNLTQKLKKVEEELERVAREAANLNREGKEIVARESEKASEMVGRKKGKEVIIDRESEEGMKVVGREKEMDEIIDQLIYFSRSRTPGTPVPVIAIVGLAGIGKTTLAQLVCKDDKVQKQVGLPAWVSVSDNTHTFDTDYIASQIKKIYPSPTENLNIFVILDDLKVEIENRDLINLQDNLEKAGLRVAAIMITTRSCLAVRRTHITARPFRDSSHASAQPNEKENLLVKSYALAGLNEEESLSLFETILGRCEGDNSLSVSNITEDVRRKIVGQCRGVPLAIVIMAKLLYARPSRLAELKEDFLHELVNFYYDVGLPKEIELCLAYCSMFPQDYLIDAERLIHLWMAEGLVEYSSEPEEIGHTTHTYLRDLVGRSIFQDVKEDESGVVRSCRMHPLMHDLARFLADRENITVDPNGHKVHRKVRRASFDLSLDFSRGIPATLFDKAKQLRSMLFFAETQSRLPQQLEMSTRVLENIFKSFKSLCVLDLRDLGIVVVPSSIGDLKDLEYLDLSLNDMEKLPSSITKLSKLQTLKLSHCYLLKELPKNFKNLAQLKHLDMEGCLGLTRMPRKMSKLCSLRTLSTFVARKNEPMGGLKELENLKQWIGHFEILHMERVQDPESREIQISSILGAFLQRLTLRWDLNLGVDQEEDEHNLLPPQFRLVLPDALEVLILVGYQCPRLRDWFKFDNHVGHLVKLSLYDCHKCISLLELENFPRLKIVELLRLDNLEHIVPHGEESADSAPLYSTLKELKISDCPKLKSWWPTRDMEEEIKEHGFLRRFFVRISKLHVHHCPLLTFIPMNLGLVEELVLVGCSLKLLPDTISQASDAQAFSRSSSSDAHAFSRLRSMVISSVTKNSTIFLDPPHYDLLENVSGGFEHLSSLQRLTIENCAEINLDSKSNQWEGLKSLYFLTIREIPMLRSLSFGHSVTSLRELSLHNCHGLTSISDSIGKVTSLRRLLISKCNKLESLPQAMKDLKSLKTLIILDCALLLPRCQPETGNDWPQISHINHVQVK